MNRKVLQPSIETRARGEGHGRAKLTAAEVVEMRRLRSDGMLIVDLARHFRVSERTVGNIIARRSWRHV